MSAPVDVRGVIRATIEQLRASGDTGMVENLLEADGALSELFETAHRAEVSFNSVRRCYERNPGNFAAAMRELEQDVIPLRAALARVTGEKA